MHLRYSTAEGIEINTVRFIAGRLAIELYAIAFYYGVYKLPLTLSKTNLTYGDKLDLSFLGYFCKNFFTATKLFYLILSDFV